VTIGDILQMGKVIFSVRSRLRSANSRRIAIKQLPLDEFHGRRSVAELVCSDANG
jgi:hypothetical protein